VVLALIQLEGITATIEVWLPARHSRPVAEYDSQAWMA